MGTFAWHWGTQTFAAWPKSSSEQGLCRVGVYYAVDEYPDYCVVRVGGAAIKSANNWTISSGNAYGFQFYNFEIYSPYHQVAGDSRYSSMMVSNRIVIASSSHSERSTIANETVLSQYMFDMDAGSTNRYPPCVLTFDRLKDRESTVTFVAHIQEYCNGDLVPPTTPYLFSYKSFYSSGNHLPTITIPALPKYTVTFNTVGGENGPANATIYYDEPIKLPVAVPTRKGYAFLGWATSPTGDAVYAPGDTFSTYADTTLYAVWDYLWSLSMTSGYIDRRDQYGLMNDGGDYVYVSGAATVSGRYRLWADVEIAYDDGVVLSRAESIDWTLGLPDKPEGDGRAIGTFAWYSLRDKRTFAPESQYTLHIVGKLYTSSEKVVYNPGQLFIDEGYLEPGETETFTFEGIGPVRLDDDGNPVISFIDLTGGLGDSTRHKADVSATYADGTLTVEFSYPEGDFGEDDVVFYGTVTYWIPETVEGDPVLLDTQTVPVTLLKGVFLMDFAESGEGIGIGTIAPDEGLRIGIPTEMDDKLVLGRCEKGVNNVIALSPSEGTFRINDPATGDNMFDVAVAPDDGDGMYLTSAMSTNFFTGDVVVNGTTQTGKLSVGYDCTTSCDIRMTANDTQITRPYRGTSWIAGRDGAVLRVPDSGSSSFDAVISSKTPAASWDLGTIGERFALSRATDANYTSGTNNTGILYAEALPAGTSMSLGGFISSGGYWGMRTPENTDTWIRTTSSGLIPATANSTSGASGLGTSGWPFATAYIKTVHAPALADVTTINGTAIATYIRNQVPGYVIMGWTIVTLTSGTLAAGAAGSTLSTTWTCPSGTTGVSCAMIAFSMSASWNSTATSLSGTTVTISAIPRRAYGSGSGTCAARFLVIAIAAS